MAIDVNIPSQVKNYANLAAFPATGTLKTIFIAEDTNKTYRWTGSAYVEISASQATAWGAITGTLSNQTDLQTALNAKQDSLGFTAVPQTRTLTINGTTQDLSADRTFTISTGITIGTTAITSGTVGRVLFEGAGNVVQESANLFWDNTNGRLGIGTSSPLQSLDIVTSSITSYPRIRTTSTASNTDVGLRFQDGTTGTGNGDGLYIGRASAINYLWTYEAEPLAFGANNLERMRIVNTGNVLINTTTDAGFKTDINGTLRVQANLTLTAGSQIKFGTTNRWIGNPELNQGVQIYAINSGDLIQMTTATQVNISSAGGITPQASAITQIDSTTKGFLPPRMTTTQKNAIATPATGLMVYDTTLNLITYYNGTTWI